MKETMYRKESRIILSAGSSLLIMAIYALHVYNKYVVVNPLVLHDFHFWGKTMLILIPVMIVAQIIIHIVYAIINKIVTHEDIPTISDEMDKLIELKALRVSHWINVLGFFLAMASQAMGMKPWILIVVIIISGIVASLAADIARIIYYRRGV
jgi:hypothetical protein